MPPFWARWWFWLYVVTWAPYVGCLLRYGLRSPWRSTRTGRALFTQYASIVAVLTLVIVGQVAVIPRPVWLAFVAVTLVGVAAAGLMQLSNIVSLQREAVDATDRKGKRL